MCSRAPQPRFVDDASLRTDLPHLPIFPSGAAAASAALPGGDAAPEARPALSSRLGLRGAHS